MIVVTHEGKHHADEVLAVWMFRQRFDDVRVIRSNQPADYEHADVLLDCGGIYDPGAGRFDHHGSRVNLPRSAYRPHGYATAGLVWRQFGIPICQSLLEECSTPSWLRYAAANRGAAARHAEELANRIDKEIVAPVDAWDNGHHPPSDLSKNWLPMQWLLGHLEFETAVDALGKALTARLRILADMIADEWYIRRAIMEDGQTEFYLAGEGVLVCAAPGERIEVPAARRAVQSEIGRPVVAVISSIRHGHRWAALLASPVAPEFKIPSDIEFTLGRKNFFHASRDRLIQFVRMVMPERD